MLNDSGSAPRANGRRRRSRKGGTARSQPHVEPSQPAYRPDPLPELSFPPELPVSAARAEIARAIAAYPVVIVCGETGSGKTTQLPKICVLAGRGLVGRIGHTQPRRIAATAVARRIAEELGTEPGRHVGWKIRFGETLAPGASIKLMTDGILLAETQTDPLLRQYDTLIIDEAHERSLNIDFLLGYLKQLIEGPRRDDLKLIITSATIDASRFAAHFAGALGPAPIIEVSGRLYPVDVRYRGIESNHDAPGDSRRPDEDDETDLPSRIEDAVAELWREAPGDVLVFLPGEREIRDCADHLRRVVARQQGAPTVFSRGAIEILPLYARLPSAEQQKIFSPGNTRRIVLATNVAETSLTVPGIRYVVDSGLARVKRYRFRGKVEQLQIEPISQAAANQRAGRCGRQADGVCIRLYDETDFASRSEHTDPEILRSSLAGVILRMKSLRLEDIESFPFLDAPPRKAVNDAYALLQELHAADEQGRLSQIGEQLARLPLDPKMGRMLLAAKERDCLREVLIIVSGLSSLDPRLRPLSAQQAADTAHKRFVDPQSDFVAWVRLWDYWQREQSTRAERAETRRQFSQRLEREFLSIRRLREWADVHGQLLQALRDLGWQIGQAQAGSDQLHQALLTGLLGNLGTRAPDAPDYQGTHQTRFSIHPGSAVVRKPPRWLMAAEMVDTGKLYARTVARIEPDWIERAGSHLLRRSWSEPFWSRDAGEILAYERATIYGLTVFAQRRVAFAQREPVLARQMLILHGLVRAQWLDPAKARHLPFLERNARLIAEIEKLEHRIRRPELLVDERFLCDWFDARLPAEVSTGNSLERWYRQTVRSDPDALCLRREELLRKDAAGVDSSDFPREIAHRGASFRLEYHFDLGARDDGVTMSVPLALLNQVDENICDWLVPGMLRNKLEALLRSLPPKQRRHVVPVAAYASAFVIRWADRVGSMALTDALREDLREQASLQVAATDFKLESLPAHLTMRIRLFDGDDRFLGASRSLQALRSKHGEHAQGAFQNALASVTQQLRRADAKPAAPDQAASAQRADRAHADPAAVLVDAGRRFTDWGFGSLPELMELRDPASGASMVGFPALVDRVDAVELCVLDDPEQAKSQHRMGLLRLFRLKLREPLRFFERNIPEFQRMSLLYAMFGGADELRDSLSRALLDRVCMMAPLPEDAAAFTHRVDDARTRLSLLGQELARLVHQILTEHQPLARKLAGITKAHVPAAKDISEQLSALVPGDFIISTPPEQLKHLPRYLKGISVRIDGLKAAPERDAQRLRELTPLLFAYHRHLGDRQGRPDSDWSAFRWLLEELRISLFAQVLRTPMPVSVKRLHKVLATLH